MPEKVASTGTTVYSLVMLGGYYPVYHHGRDRFQKLGKNIVQTSSLQEKRVRSGVLAASQARVFLLLQLLAISEGVAY